MSIALKALLEAVGFCGIVFAVCVAPGIAWKAVMKKR